MLLEGLGVRHIPYSELDLTAGALDRDRLRRGDGPLSRAE